MCAYALRPTVEGVDVSVYQKVIDWDALSNSEIKYAIMRTGYGTGTLDTQFERNWAESERVGMIRGVYHFSANRDVVTQARIMLDEWAQCGRVYCHRPSTSRGLMASRRLWFAADS